jgi:WD40-like Beta Propeller Repeat
MGSRIGVLIACAALCTTLLVTPAHATFPGANGKIAFTFAQEHGDWDRLDIGITNADGTGRAVLTTDPATDQWPEWSPDGRKIAFLSDRDGEFDIFVMDADGSNQTSLTPGPGREIHPQWSGDGTKMAFFSNRDGNDEIYVMDADGSNQTRLTNNPLEDQYPYWSPDGTKIGFTRSSSSPPQADVYTVNVDGSGPELLTGEPSHTYDRGPVWSPDGGTLAFHAYGVSFDPDLWMMNPDGSGKRFISSLTLRGWQPVGDRITVGPSSSGAGHSYTMNRDGTDVQQLTNDLEEQAGDWSPDGRYITGLRSHCPYDDLPCDPFQLFAMRSDGTDRTELGHGFAADWQPIPINGYPRPIATDPVAVSLVLAYERCTAPNRTHGPPLDEPSCAPPLRSSGQLTVGTPDSNGRPSNGNATVIVNARHGDPTTTTDEADVRLRAAVTDVRLAFDFSDYTGSLQARVGLRITDKDNTPHPGGPGAATVSDITYSFPVPCAATDKDDTIGSQCAVDTTADALVPGTVKERRRTIWQLGQVALHDGAGNAFMRQGIFVP